MQTSNVEDSNTERSYWFTPKKYLIRTSKSNGRNDVYKKSAGLFFQIVRRFNNFVERLVSRILHQIIGQIGSTINGSLWYRKDSLLSIGI